MPLRVKKLMSHLHEDWTFQQLHEFRKKLVSGRRLLAAQQTVCDLGGDVEPVQPERKAQGADRTEEPGRQEVQKQRWNLFACLELSGLRRGKRDLPQLSSEFSCFSRLEKHPMKNSDDTLGAVIAVLLGNRCSCNGVKPLSIALANLRHNKVVSTIGVDSCAGCLPAGCAKSVFAGVAVIGVPIGHAIPSAALVAANCATILLDWLVHQGMPLLAGRTCLVAVRGSDDSQHLARSQFEKVSRI
mmetsp:Transcript_86247/g.189447  ORF Transcript_86247/g.189447 Transcript_86247/m.189447 type:complete len:243 (+) Transcript_86247:120-848(+)